MTFQQQKDTQIIKNKSASPVHIEYIKHIKNSETNYFGARKSFFIHADVIQCICSSDGVRVITTGVTFKQTPELLQLRVQ